MKIKHKLHFGFGILFVMVIFFGALSLFFLNQLSNSSRVILKDNYASLAFVREMRSILDENELPLTREAAEKFNVALVKEQSNITEKGEEHSVAELLQSFESLRNSSIPLQQQLQAKRKALRYLGQIEKLNLDAVERKSNKAESSIKSAAIYLGIGGAVTFLVLFTSIFNLTALFEEALRDLIDAINDVSKKDFKSRLEFDKKDEFGEVSQAFNKMVENLNKWKGETDARIETEVVRTETILKHLIDPVIALNENEEIILLNPAAEKLLNLDKKTATGVKANKLSEQNQTLKGILSTRNGQLKIRESDFQLETKEILLTSSHFPDVTNDIPMFTSGRSAGEVIFLKKNEDKK